MGVVAGLTSHPIAANHWWTTGRKRTPVNTTTTAAANAGSAKQGRKPYNSSFPRPGADFWKRRKKVVLLFVCPLAGSDPANRELASATFVRSWCPLTCWFGLVDNAHHLFFLSHILNHCLFGLMVNIVHLPSIRRFLKQDLLGTRGLNGDNVFTLMVSKQHSVVCFLTLNKVTTR